MKFDPLRPGLVVPPGGPSKSPTPSDRARKIARLVVLAIFLVDVILLARGW